MAGQVKRMIDKLINEKAKGDKVIENSVRIKLILNGIDVDSFTDDTPDDFNAIEKINAAAKELGINLD